MSFFKSNTFAAIATTVAATAVISFCAMVFDTWRLQRSMQTEIKLIGEKAQDVYTRTEATHDVSVLHGRASENKREISKIKERLIRLEILSEGM